MKNRIKNIVIVVICLFFLLEILLKRELVFSTVNSSLDIWITSLLPSLFPFFVISDLLISYDIIRYIPSFIKSFFKFLFNVSDNGLFVYFISMLSGFPSNARNIKSMYLDGKISKEEGEQLLIFTHFSNPMFILGTLVSIFFKNSSLGLVILISHFLPNFILGILFRDNNVNSGLGKKNVSNGNFGIVLTRSIKKSLDSVLSILGTVTVFLLISTILVNVFSLSKGSSLLVKGVLELTTGLKYLSTLGLSNRYLVILSSCFLSFGGLSVHMQVINEISETDIGYRNFFIGRILQTILSLIISYLLTL